MTPMLDVRNIDTYYGSSQVLKGLSLQVQPGQVVTLLGRNGMGKTTTVRSITGLLTPKNGDVFFRGERLGSKRADQIARYGISLVPEGRQIFANLTVEENLIAFARKRADGVCPWNISRVYALFPRLRERCSNMGNQLSGGEQQMLAIGRALMINPHLIVIDEATEGLAPLVREEIWNCLRTLKDEGQAILVIDKYVERLIPLADHHYIVESGKVVWSGDSQALRADPSVWTRYLGV